MKAMLAIALIAAISAPARADPKKVAVFDFELVDTSLQGEVDGPRNDERERLLHAAAQLRRELTLSGRFQLLDIAPVNDAAHRKNLQSCGGCDVDYARTLGADIAMTGTVQKVSNLILNMNIYLRDVPTGQLIISMSTDMRGNTDESWSRAVSYLVRNRLVSLDDDGRLQAR